MSHLSPPDRPINPPSFYEDAGDIEMAKCTMCLEEVDIEQINPDTGVCYDCEYRKANNIY